MNDWILLRDYVDHRSEAAFEALVKRHIRMVYSAALRRVRDPHLAQDVTQAVFVLLARKAPKLRSSVVLGGWLYRTAGFVARRALRDQARRRHNEREAATMPVAESIDELWETLTPHVDAAMAELGETDRNVVVLRYLQQRSFRDVASSLGVSEEAAKKRVARALEKLREKVARRGVATTSVAFSTVLAAKAVQAAPAAVVEASVKAGLDSALAVAPAALALAAGVMRDWLVTRVKWGFGSLAAASLVVVAITLPARTPTIRSDSNATPSAPVNEVTGSAALQNPGGDLESDRAEASPHAMQLHVLDATTGAGLADALVRINAYGTKLQGVELTANAEGVVQVAVPKERFQGMAMWVAAPGHVPKCLSWRREEEPVLPGEYNVRLDAGLRVAGRVLDEQGRPVTGVRLEFDGGGGVWNSREYVDYRTRLTKPETDRLGYWVADFLDAGKESVRGLMNHPDFAETDFKIALQEASLTNVTLTIVGGVPVSGGVRDADGKPIMEAKVVAAWGHAWRHEVERRSDFEGRFTFEHLTRGKFQLKASADGYRSYEVWFDTGHAGTNIEATLIATRIAGNSVLRGRVVDESGSPIPGVHASLSHGQTGLEEVAWQTETDDEGRFVWKNAPDRLVKLYFSSWDYESLPEVELQPGAAEHVVTMKAVKTVIVRGKVTDKNSGMGLNSFKVMHGETDPEPLSARRAADLRFLGEGQDGVFAFRIIPSQERNSVLQIEAAHYVPQIVELPNDSEGDIELDVVMQPSDEIEGVVLLANGQPAVGAQIGLVGKGLTAIMQQPAQFLKYDSPFIHIATAAADGSFRLAPNPNAERLAVIHDQGWASPPVGTVRGGVIDLQAWGRIEGVLRLGNRPAANEKVGADSGGWGSPLADTVAFNYSTKTDASGQFRFDKVPAGRARVYRLLELNPGGSGYVAFTQSIPVEVQAGQTTPVELGGKGVMVKGRLIARPPRTDIVWRMRPQNLRPSALQVEPGKVSPGYGFFCRDDGSFVVEDIPPGSYVLEAEAPRVKNPNDPESSLHSYPIGDLKREFVIPEQAADGDIFVLGDVEVPVKSN